MRNETPAWKVYAEVFGIDDPATVHARKFRRNLWHLDHLMRTLYWQARTADALRGRGTGQPDLSDLHAYIKLTMRSWCAADFPLEAIGALHPMSGESVHDICEALESLPVLLASGLTDKDVQRLLYDGYSVPALARALEASGGLMEYAMAIVVPDVPRVAPF